jgi:hypothetical protein
MLARIIASYTERNTNLKRSVQGAMLISTNGTTTVRKIPAIIRGKRKNVAPPDQDSQGSKEIKVHVHMMWYIPIIDCLKRMFSNPRDARLLLWHVQQKRDGKI